MGQLGHGNTITIVWQNFLHFFKEILRFITSLKINSGITRISIFLLIDLQAFPGCTGKEFVDQFFRCLRDFTGGLPFADKYQCRLVEFSRPVCVQANWFLITKQFCRAYANQSLDCLHQVTQKCIQFRSDGVTPCPSVFDSIPSNGIIHTV